MTAKELIEKLQQLDPDQVIYMEYDDGYCFISNFTDDFGLTEGGFLTNNVQEKWL